MVKIYLTVSFEIHLWFGRRDVYWIVSSHWIEHILFRFFFLIWEKDGERKSSPICLFTSKWLQHSGQNQEIYMDLATCVEGVQTTGPFYVSFQLSSAGNWIRIRAAWPQTDSLKWNTSVTNGGLTHHTTPGMEIHPKKVFQILKWKVTYDIKLKMKINYTK